MKVRKFVPEIGVRVGATSLGTEKQGQRKQKDHYKLGACVWEAKSG